jgi:hypothetical protein
MALITKDQFFELWFPGTYWDRSNKALGGHDTAGARRNARESPNGSRQFAAAWEAYNRDQIAAENPKSVIDTPYVFGEPAPTFTKWSGPCYDNNCRNLRASIEAAEKANYASWQTRKSQAEAAEQKRLYEAALFQEAEVKSQKYEAEQATAFLLGEQKRVQQELELEKQRISQEQIKEQSNIEAQISAARVAAQQEQTAIKSQFETDKTATQAEQAAIRSQFETDRTTAQAEQAAIQSQFQTDKSSIEAKQVEIKSQFEMDIASIQKQQTDIKTQFEQEKATTERNIAEAGTETARQQLIAKKQTAIQKKAASGLAVTQQPNVEPQQTTKKKRPMIGQPGVAVTRFNPRTSIGGYGGTASTRVNPTGLNI